MATKRNKKVEEETLQTGDVIDANEKLEPEKNDTVTVASNMPRDCIFEVVDNRGRKQEVLIKGNAGHLRGKAAGILSEGAYGITTNVPVEAWEQIKRNFAEDNRFKQGLIFASTAGKVRKEAIERKDLRNGFEPIDPKQVKTDKFKE